MSPAFSPHFLSSLLSQHSPSTAFLRNLYAPSLALGKFFQLSHEPDGNYVEFTDFEPKFLIQGASEEVPPRRSLIFLVHVMVQYVFLFYLS